MDEKVRHIDLCSGIGGFALAAGWAGAATGRDVRTVAFCEIDPFCQAVLAHHWPGVPIIPDLRNFDYEGGCDLITAGYPCTPFSTAGQQKGAADDRFLWPSVLEILQQKRPAWCLFENVPGHITLGLDEVLLDLANQGYAARTLHIGAVSKNAPHRRMRVWVCARNVADTKRVRQPGPGQSVRPRDTEENQNGKTGGADYGSQGRQGRWSLVEPMGDQAHGIPGWVAGDWERGVPRVEKKEEMRKEKLTALGNSVVPQIAAEILEAMFRNWDHV